MAASGTLCGALGPQFARQHQRRLRSPRRVVVGNVGPAAAPPRHDGLVVARQPALASAAASAVLPLECVPRSENPEATHRQRGATCTALKGVAVHPRMLGNEGSDRPTLDPPGHRNAATMPNLPSTACSGGHLRRKSTNGKSSRRPAEPRALLRCRVNTARAHADWMSKKPKRTTTCTSGQAADKFSDTCT